MNITRWMTCAATMLAASSIACAKSPASFHDLNRNGQLDRYEDRTLTIDARVADLVARMTIEEKAGALLHPSMPNLSEEQSLPKRYSSVQARSLLLSKHVTSILTTLSADPGALATQNNRLQMLARSSRLGIPLTISSDPRHHSRSIIGQSTTSAGFSQWPETLGLAALGDPERVRRFGDIARQEYRAVGINMALSPQADLSVEPRWSRVNGTFGSDPEQVSTLVKAFVAGFQNGAKGLGRGGVATVTKHWVAYGAAPDGFDASNHYGRHVRVDNAELDRHIAGFHGAFEAGTAGVMPTYAIVSGASVNGLPLEPVGAAYSRELLDGLLRQRFGFEGVVLSDWLVTRDCPESCARPTAANPQKADALGMPWGVEGLSPAERFAKALNAGVDQFGGEDDPAPILDAIRMGLVSLPTIDRAVSRVMKLKFQLGLFDEPFVDEKLAPRIAGNARWRQEGLTAQAESLVLLQNDGVLGRAARKGSKLWVYGIDPKAVVREGYRVARRLDDADFAILRLSTPFETLHPNRVLAWHEGRVHFTNDDADFRAFVMAQARKPTIALVDMDRPADLLALLGANAVIAAFGVSDQALMKAVSGEIAMIGRLPIALPGMPPFEVHGGRGEASGTERSVPQAN